MIMIIFIIIIISIVIIQPDHTHPMCGKISYFYLFLKDRGADHITFVTFVAK